MVGVLKNSDTSIYQIASKTYEKVGALAIDYHSSKDIDTKVEVFIFIFNPFSNLILKITYFYF